MLEIDNIEEIEQYLLKETGSPEAADKIIELFERQEFLSPIYDKCKKYSKFENEYIFYDSKPHSLEEIEKRYKEITRGYTYYKYPWAKLTSGFFPSNPSIEISLVDLAEQIAAIITIGDFSYKLYKENKGTINNFIQTNVSKENISKELFKMIKKAAIKLKIRDTSKEETTTIAENKEP